MSNLPQPDAATPRTPFTDDDLELIDRARERALEAAALAEAVAEAASTGPPTERFQVLVYCAERAADQAFEAIDRLATLANQRRTRP